jgi:hypothetical protein
MSQLLQMFVWYVTGGIFILIASRHAISKHSGFSAFFVVAFRFFMWPFFVGWRLSDFMKSGDL